MAPRSFSSTLVVLMITLPLSSLISTCVATPRLAPKSNPNPNIIPPVTTKATQNPVSVTTQSSVTPKSSASITTSSVVLSSAISSVVSQKDATSSQTLSTDPSSASLTQVTSIASANSSLMHLVATPSTSNATLLTNLTSQSTTDPDLPSSPLDLSNDPNDGEYFSPSIASRQFYAYGYNAESNRTLVGSAKWTNRQGDIRVPRGFLDANLQKRRPTVCGAPKNIGNVAIYELDCDKFPEICQNACFFIACKPGAEQAAVPGEANTLELTLDRKNNGRRLSECRGDNKCSAVNQPRDETGWGKMSERGRQCDEFPFNVVRPGGDLAATRCVPSRENSRQGRDFQSFINAQGPYRTIGGVKRHAIRNCGLVRVTPTNLPPGSLCRALAEQRPQLCTAASPGPHAAGAAQDLNRQE